MKLFNLTSINLFSASSVNQSIQNKKAATHEIFSLCGEYVCTITAKPTRSHAAFSADIVLRKGVEKCDETLSHPCGSVAELKDYLRECFQDWNEVNPEPIKQAKPTNKEIFSALPIGAHLTVTFANGRTFEAIKRSNTAFIFNNYGTWKNHVVTPVQTLDVEFPTHPRAELIQDPYNKAKQYVLVRQNFRECVLFQLVSGEQFGKCKMTDDEITKTFDFITQGRLNRVLHGTYSESAARLYKAKLRYLNGLSKNWRIDAKVLCINPDSLAFMTHVDKERELIPLIARTQRAMLSTNSYDPRYGVKCWWDVPSIYKIINAAVEAGFLTRPSITQVGWTKKGIEAARDFHANFTHKIYA